MDYEEKIAQADKRAAAAAAYRDKLRIVAVAEAEIPSVWDTGQVTITGLATTYGISPVTVKRILKTHGRVIKRMRKLSDEERNQVAALLQQGELPEALASKYSVSKNTIRRIGIEEGVFIKGQRRPRRSDAEYEVIRAFDEEARSRFNGAGLYNLGLGLKAHDAKKKNEARALANATSEPQPVDGDDNEILPPDEAYPNVPDTGTPEQYELDTSNGDAVGGVPTDPAPSETTEETNYNF